MSTMSPKLAASAGVPGLGVGTGLGGELLQLFGMARREQNLVAGFRPEHAERATDLAGADDADLVMRFRGRLCAGRRNAGHQGQRDRGDISCKGHVFSPTRASAARKTQCTGSRQSWSGHRRVSAAITTRPSAVRAAIASDHETARDAMPICWRSYMRFSTLIAARLAFSGLSKASMTSLARRTSSADGANEGVGRLDLVRMNQGSCRRSRDRALCRHSSRQPSGSPMSFQTPSRMVRPFGAGGSQREHDPRQHRHPGRARVAPRCLWRGRWCPGRSR